MMMREQLRKILGDIKCVMEDFRENGVVFNETYILLGYNNDILKGLSLEFVVDENYEKIPEEQSYDNLRRLIKGCLADDIEISYVITNGGVDKYELQGSFYDVKEINDRIYDVKFIVFIEPIDDPFSFDNENYELNVNTMLGRREVDELENIEYEEILEDFKNLLPEPSERVNGIKLKRRYNNE